MSRILVLPGTEWQLPLVEKIIKMGHQPVVVSPENNSPCRSKAVRYLQSNIFDIERIVEFAKEVKVDAVLSDECDIATPVVAELGHCLGLHTMTMADASLYTDKFLMREFCARNGLNTPEYRLCKTVDEAIEFLNEINKPLIIKPLDSNASHGVFTIEKVEELRTHFDEAMSFSRVEKAVLAERYINGTEFTIDGIKTPNAHYTLAISEKKHYEHNPNIANELYFTHCNNRFDYEELKLVNDTFVIASKLKFGFTHAEYKYEDGKYYLIEIGARGGGNLISAIITQHMSGYDTYRYLIESAVNGAMVSDFGLRNEYKVKAAVLKFFETPGKGGTVKSIQGIDYLEEEPDIKCFHLNFDVDDQVEEAKNDSVRIGYYIACSNSEEKLREIMMNVDMRFHILLK